MVQCEEEEEGTGGAGVCMYVRTVYKVCARSSADWLASQLMVGHCLV